MITNLDSNPADSNGDRSSQQGVQALEIGLELALLMASANDAELPLSEIARRAKMSTSKIHRYMVSLSRAGIIQQNFTTGHYSIAPFAIELGLMAQSQLDPIAAAETVIERLHAKIRLPVAASIWTSNGPVIVRRAELQYPLIIGTAIGTALPVATSSIGRIFAAFGRSDEIDRLLDQEFLSKSPPTLHGQKMTKVAFKRLIREVREIGIASQQGDLILGLQAIAAPVFDAEGRMVMCLSVVALDAEKHFGPESSEALALREASSELSRNLGYSGQGE